VQNSSRLLERVGWEGRQGANPSTVGENPCGEGEEQRVLASPERFRGPRAADRLGDEDTGPTSGEKSGTTYGGVVGTRLLLADL